MPPNPPGQTVNQGSPNTEANAWPIKITNFPTSCECGCINELRERLNDSNQQFVVIFEKNRSSYVRGKLEEVGNFVVKIGRFSPNLPVLKTFAIGSCTFDAQFDTVFIPICEIADFIAGDFIDLRPTADC